jgi:uncharacterized RDD family membrane protein YckC
MNAQTGDSQGGWTGTSGQAPAHAYDPATQPELFEGVLGRRVAAFFIDATVLFLPVLFAAFALSLFGILTLGLGFALFGLFMPATIIWILGYYWFAYENPKSATIGMRIVDLEMRRWTGEPMYGLLGVIHALAFYITVSVLTPLALVFALFNDRRRQLYDFGCGTVVINNAHRADVIRRTGR